MGYNSYEYLANKRKVANDAMCNNYMYRYYINEAYTFISTFNLRHAIILYLTGICLDTGS